MISITLVAGAAVFGFVNGESGTSAQAVGNDVSSNINFLNEREVIVYAAMQGVSPSTQANVWVYNFGLFNPMIVSSIPVFQGASQVTGCSLTTIPVQSPALSIPVGTVIQFQITCTTPVFATGSSYTFIVIGHYGSRAQLTVQF